MSDIDIVIYSLGGLMFFVGAAIALAGLATDGET